MLKRFWADISKVLMASGPSRHKQAMIAEDVAKKEKDAYEIEKDNVEVEKK